MRAASLKRINP